MSPPTKSKESTSDTIDSDDVQLYDTLCGRIRSRVDKQLAGLEIQPDLQSQSHPDVVAVSTRPILSVLKTVRPTLNTQLSSLLELPQPTSSTAKEINSSRCSILASATISLGHFIYHRSRSSISHRSTIVFFETSDAR